MSEEFDFSLGGWLFREARFLLSTDFVVHRIRHCNRACNVVAHELARARVNRDPDEPLVWLDPLPAFVLDILIRNSAGSVT